MTQAQSNIRRFLSLSALALAVPLSALAQQAPATTTSAPATTGAMPYHHHGHQGQQGRQGKGMHGGEHMAMMRDLGLSAEQKTQMKALFDAQRPAFEEKSKAVREAREALHLLVVSGKYTPEKAAELAKDISQKETPLLLLRAEQGNKMQQILTPEQRSKQQAQMQERMKQREAMRGSMQGGMHGARY